MAETSDNTAVTTSDFRTTAGEIQFAYIAQEVNWPHIFYGAASPGQVYGLEDYFAALYTTKEVSVAIASTFGYSEPYVASITVERNLIAQANIVTVAFGGTMDDIDHVVLYVGHNGLIAPFETASPGSWKATFVDKEHFDVYGTVFYRASIFNGPTTTFTTAWAGVTPSTEITRYSSLDIYYGSESDEWGSENVISAISI
jgi:hypothetical protein